MASLYIQSVVNGTPAVQEVARLTHSTFVWTMKACEASLALTISDSFELYVQALTDFWAAKLDVAPSDMLVQLDRLCLPAAEPFKF